MENKSFPASEDSNGKLRRTTGVLPVDLRRVLGSGLSRHILQGRVKKTTGVEKVECVDGEHDHCTVKDVCVRLCVSK